jgi:hypothetical protein
MVAARLVALELNDAGLVAARWDADEARPVLQGPPSPGFAVLHDGRVLVGQEAFERHRLAPVYAQNRYWQALGVEPLPWSARGVATAADLAHAHLSALLVPAIAAGANEAVLAVPPGYTREQLGLLVGIANEAGATVRGLVDLGIAAAATVPPAPHMLHLDLQLHQAAATLLESSRADGVLRRVRYELLPGAGVIAFNQAIAGSIATTFVRETRFDPLHEATTEQRLHDRMPGWLAALAEQDEVEAAIEAGGLTHQVTLQRAQLIAAVAKPAADVLRLVQGARPAGTMLHVCITPRVAAVPGLLANLTALRDCTVVMLEPGAAAVGALQAAAAIVRAPDSISLVHRLPLPGATEALATTAVVGSDAVPADAVPTHVLFRGRAWPLTAVPLTLGWSVGAAARALALPAGIAGVSRSHCALWLRDGQAIVEDQSTYGTFVNDERVGGRVALRVGDVLRLGAPGVTLELIRVMESSRSHHGTA